MAIKDTPEAKAIKALRAHLCAKHGWDERDLDPGGTHLSYTILHEHEHDPRLPGPAPTHTQGDLGL